MALFINIALTNARDWSFLQRSLHTGTQRVTMTTIDVVGRSPTAPARCHEVVEVNHKAELTVGVPVQTTRPDSLFVTVANACGHILEVCHTVAARDFKRTPEPA